MKTFLTTAAMVAALTMPAFAQSAGTDTRGEASGNVKSSTSIQDNKGPNAQDTNTMGTGAKGSATVGTSATVAPGTKSPAMNEKAGDTAAGEAKK